MNASSSWWPRRTGNTPPWLKTQPIGPAEQLRLAHELHAPAEERAGEEVVHERGMIGGEDHRPVGHVLDADSARAEGDQRMQHGHHPDHLVHLGLGLARAHALVELVEVLLGARVLVDLRLELDVGHGLSLIPRYEPGVTRLAELTRQRKHQRRLLDHVVVADRPRPPCRSRRTRSRASPSRGCAR